MIRLWPRTRSKSSLPTRPVDASGSEWAFWEESFSWYDGAAHRSRITYWLLKLYTLAAGALITTLAAADTAPLWVAGLAASALVAEGIQQTGQFHANYIAYRLIAENLYMHGWLFSVGEDPYGDADVAARARRLTRNVADLISSQNSDWGARMLQASRPAPGAVSV